MKKMKLSKDILLVITDVDDTVAPAFKEASEAMVKKLEMLLEAGTVIFFVSGQSLQNIYKRVISKIERKYYDNILIAHCNGSEVFQFKGHGESKKVFSIVDEWRDVEIERELREVVSYVLKQFELQGIEASSLQSFLEQSDGNVSNVMLDDRKLQIAMDFVYSEKVEDFDLPKGHKGVETGDIRELIVACANQYIEERNYHIKAVIAGTCAIDFVIQGVNKGLPVRKMLECQWLDKISEINPSQIEVWGDSFEQNGSDLQMSLALPADVLSISFRKMKNDIIDKNCTVISWNGERECSEGLLEYLGE